MAFIIIKNEKTAIQYTLVDFIEELTWEIVDCGTQEGKRRKALKNIKLIRNLSERF